MLWYKYAPYVFWVGLSLATGYVGAYLSFDGVSTWYASLIQPSWTPPNWMFAPLWFVLYLCMGIAAAKVSKAAHRTGKKYVLRLFAFHLLVNASWPYVFFGLHLPVLAFIIMCLLWLYILILILLFSTYSRRASLLLVPYSLWVAYAATINAGIIFLNP